MRARTCWIGTLALLLVGGWIAAADPAWDEPRAREDARELTGMLYRGEVAAIHARFSESLQEIMPQKMVQGLQQRIVRELGPETEVVSERTESKGRYVLYKRRARYERMANPFEMTWSIRQEDGLIAGLFMREVTPPPAGDSDAAEGAAAKPAGS